MALWLVAGAFCCE